MSKRSAFKDLLRTLADAGLLEFGSVIKRTGHHGANHGHAGAV